jgi:cytochrome P450
MIHAIVNSNLPASEKSHSRVFEEIGTLMGAAFETTANALRLIVFHVYSNPHILQKLRAELATLARESSEVPLSKLEQLPYLTAVLMEGMRLSPAIASRAARVTDKDLFYDNWRIPARTPVGMTALLIHTDVNIFPDPMRFDPERWMGKETRRANEKMYAPFGRGTRICLGMQ